MNNSLLDTTYSIEAPEGIDLDLRPAGPLPRVLAYAIDLLIRGSIMLALSFVLGALGVLGVGILLIAYFVLEWFYPVVFEVLNNGMTPGKRSLRIRVVHDDGTPVDWSSSLVRNLLRAADFLPFGYCAGLVSMTVSREFKRLGDLAAGTVVVYNEISRPTPTPSELGSRPMPAPLSSEEQRALVDFAERRTSLSSQRREELAAILSPITGKHGREGVEELEKIANGLIGRE